LEIIQKSVSETVLSSSLSDEDYLANIDELTKLYKTISDKENLLAVYEKKLDVYFSREYAELDSKKGAKTKHLLAKYASKTAYDVIDKCALQLKEILLTSNKDSSLGGAMPELNLGTILIEALGKNPDGSLKRPPPDENKEILHGIYTKLGL
jgi:hypothetical protein